MDQRQRNPNGTFQKGQPSPEGARRKKGVLNKLTADIRAGAIEGFARHGSNGRGEGGFSGFCFYLARKHPKAAARIVEKLLPLTVNANGTGFGGPVISSVNIVSIPSDNYLSQADIERLRHQEPHVIDHAPRLEHLEEPAPAEEPAPSETPIAQDVPQTALEAKLLAMDHSQLLELAEALNVGK
jgi:hypothetical protein